MARVMPPSGISARQQFGAIAYLRWRLFANGFRRKGGKGELAARILVYPVFALFVIGPAIGAGLGCWAMVYSHREDLIPGVFFGIFVLQIFVSINLSPPGLSFDPESLIRFPVTFSRYLIVRTFLGLLSASTVIGTVTMLAAATGMTVARPALGPMAFLSVLLLSVTNMFFVRMVFAWVDRWLSTRRARELFTGVIIVASVAFQYLNASLNPGFNHADSASEQRKVHAALAAYRATQGVVARLHPGLAGLAIVNVSHGKYLPAFLDLGAVTAFAAAFVGVFAWRMQREYRGEHLSDPGPGDRVPRGLPSPRLPAISGAATPLSQAAGLAAAAQSSSPILLPLVQKEWVYIRRNTAQLYALLVPIAMVFIFSGRMGSFARTSQWAFPGAIAYSTLTVAALAYNSLGLDAEGVQFYFLAPVRFRDVLLAKNLFGFGVTALQAAVVYGVIRYASGAPEGITTAATLLWLAFAVLLNYTVGNVRSITAPKKMDPGKLSRRQASQLSALISVLTVIALAGLGFGILMLAQYVAVPWLPVPILLTLAIGALVLYLAGLSGLDALALRHREMMIEELSKTS